VKYSGSVGVPAMVKNVLNSISMLKEISLEELEKQIEVNTRKIFPKIF
jgi:Tat protein secretion system quality control protein TatD with DNase activity